MSEMSFVLQTKRTSIQQTYDTDKLLFGIEYICCPAKCVRWQLTTEWSRVRTKSPVCKHISFTYAVQKVRDK